ncbi:transcriptional regulator [Paraburkholderia ginsengiterrae]|uniref:Transcriptional regulator n=1 Tax=Paraburkholderia ginsengiterrae TaxID=1462993 RepID=A0A1A9N966_9BURK|nr:winged helix-turn-helix domain-containing protein [Paraburkholderia ginsengiterrae]OAJ54895.1 transcriptional regulator [Paraburkholderia ginsengiterrae]OAJ61080.1 transcriptional regulator [Paraburkholderia ginsengiterrae]
MIRIGPLEVDVERRELSLDGQPVRLGSRAFDMLTVLIAANGGLVSKDELLKQVWPNAVVEENNLQVHMSALRKMLGESRGLIQTVSGRGYRLVPRVSSAAASGNADDDDRLERVDQDESVPHNLPVNLSALIGRDLALQDVSLALASARHVTLLGSGGIGKTRLAVEVARDSLARFPDGVYLVALASASDASSVLAAFAASIGVNPASGPLTLARFCKEFRERRVLFVLDNCEHVLGHAAELAETLLNVGPAVHVLATSREPLRIQNEHLYWVAALQVPAQDEDSENVPQYSAVELFLSRARAIDARFSSDEKSMQLTGMVCRRLDGIPLAIELAAARAAILGIATLASHLDDRFNMLTGGNRTALPRHQTLKATLDWSHAMLDEAERATLRRLGIFVSSFTMDAAIAVVNDGALREAEVIEAMSGLVEKSLMVRCVKCGEERYRLLETTRAYAMQKLEDNGEQRLAAFNHARYFAGLLEREALSRADPASAFADGWLHQMHALLDDLRMALGWALSPKGDEALGETLAVKVVFLLYELSLVDECCAWARRALDSVAATHHGSRSTRHLRVRMQLKAALGASLVYVNGPNQETFGIWSETLASAIALGDHAFEARALWGMWNASQSSGAARNALAFAGRFALLASEVGDAASAVLAYRLLGIASHYAGDQRQARASLEQFLQHSDGLHQRLPLGQSVDHRIAVCATLARVLWLQGFRDQALRLAQDSVVAACDQQQAIVTTYVLVEALVPLALLSDKRDRAAHAIALLKDVSTRAGLSVAQACCRCFDEYLHSMDDVSCERLQAFRSALDDLESVEFGAPRAMLAGQYSLALGRAGRREEGIATVVRELEHCDETGDHWYVSELRRIHGELLLMEPAGASLAVSVAISHEAQRDAEVCLVAALDESLMQGCRSLQLRAATSLGRLWHAQGRSRDAAQLLTSVCSSLTEGLDWQDFEAAGDLLRMTAAAGDRTAARGGKRAGKPPVASSSDAPPNAEVPERG